jgi:ribonuclease HII
MARKTICGLDEAGRGPLAGPIVAAAVVIPRGMELDAIDSKRLSEKQRESWAENFKATASQRGIQYAIYEIDVWQINREGIGWANREVFRQLILKMDAGEYIVDGNHKLTDLGNKQKRTQSVIRADQFMPVVSAASILAKTHRDQIMRELHERYPHYHWNKNKGYGTAQHISALKTFGGTPHHRGKYVDTVKDKVYKTRNHEERAAPLLLLGPGSSVLLALLIQFFQNVP